MNECFTMVFIVQLIYGQKNVPFFISGGIPSGYLGLPALHLSGTPSLRANTRPTSCFHLDNRLYMCMVRKIINCCVFK